MTRRERELLGELARARKTPIGRPLLSFDDWLARRNCSLHTRFNYARDGRYLAEWAEQLEINCISEVTPTVIASYERHLLEWRKPNGAPLAPSTRRNRLMSVKQYFRWLHSTNAVSEDPTAKINLPRQHRHIPVQVMNINEVETVMTVPPLSDKQGLRDRAILETFWSTGMRRAELCQLEIGDIDESRGVIRIQRGKGGRGRTVPVGERASRWIRRYRSRIRPGFATRRDPEIPHLFLTRDGRPIPPPWLTLAVGRYVRRALPGRKGACHLFRHTMATQMLDNGADLRSIQYILGHASLATTQIYTHVSVRRVKEVHQATHPAG